MMYSLSFFCTTLFDLICNRKTIVANSPEELFDNLRNYFNNRKNKKQFVKNFDISPQELKRQVYSNLAISYRTQRIEKRSCEKKLKGVPAEVALLYCCGFSRAEIQIELAIDANVLVKHFTAIRSVLGISNDDEMIPILTK